MPLLMGLMKGAAIGGGLGFGYWLLGPWSQSGILAYLFFALVGFIVGFFAGIAPWKQKTIYTSVFKGIFGALLFCGIYALVANLFNPTFLVRALDARPLTLGTTYVLGPILGILFAVFFEWDDSRDDNKKKK